MLCALCLVALRLLLLLLIIFSMCLRCALNKDGDGAIHKAAENGSLDIVKYLIVEAGVDKNVRGNVS